MTQRGKAGADLESVPFAVIVVGSDGCISTGNAIAHRMLRMPDGALRGQRLDGLMAGDDVARIAEVFTAGTPVRLQARMLKADGRAVDVSLAVDPTFREEGAQISSVTLVCKPVPPWQSLPPPGASNAGT
jgi:nitrogen fixation/metabolism regulation signal transduction histidine kinase